MDVESAVPSFLRALLTRPWPVPASRAAETPAAAATEMSPDWVRQHDRAAHGLGDPDVAPGGADLRGAVEPADLDVAVDRGEADARGLVDLDLAVRAVEGDVAEAADAAQLGAGGLGLDAGAGGQPDGDLQGSGGADELVAGAAAVIRRTPSA